MEEIVYWFWLCGLSGVTYKQRRTLIHIFESPKAVFKADAQKLNALTFLGDTAKSVLINHRNEKDIQTEYERFIKQGYRFVSENSKDYPQRLKTLYDCPLGLYYAGKLDRKSVV